MLREITALALLGLFSLFATFVTAEELNTLTVEKFPIKNEVYLDGTVEAVQQATLFAQTSGRVTQLFFDVDDSVKKGSVIAKLRDTEQRARFDQASAGLRAAIAQQKKAELEYNRVIDLFAKNLVSASNRDQAEAALKAANAELEAAEARHDEAKEQLAHTIITAPYSGTVTQRHVEVGETLQIGQPIISGIAKQDVLRFSVDVPQRLIDVVRQQDSVDIVLDNGQRMKSDELTIYPYADEKTRTFRIRAQIFSNTYRLYPGMFVKIAVNKGESHEILIPKSAIVQRSEVHGVYVQYEDGRIAFRLISLGREYNAQQRIVLSGLTVGEQIILDPLKATVAMKAQRQGE